MTPYSLAQTNYKHITSTEYEIAIIPWGATEAHNYHLPYGTDNFETEAIAEEAARISWENGVRCIVLPNIPFGVNTGQSDIPFTINLYPSTQAIILNDILESLQNTGMKKVLILNGHGGNDFKQILREAGRTFPDMFLASANWFQAIDKNKYFEHEGDHADEMETSLMIYLKNELVLPLSEAGSGKGKILKSKVLQEKWNWTERKWTSVTEDTGIGNPGSATVQKGKDAFIDITNKISNLLTDIAEMDVNDMYK